MSNVSVVTMLARGVATVRRYTGTLLTIYLAQALLAVAAIVGVGNILASEFAQRPRFDDAVDGNVVALLEVVRAAPQVVWASLAMVVTVVTIWAIVSWFLTGGLLAIVVEQPEGRASTGRCFGGGASDGFLALARVGVVSAATHLAVLSVLAMGLATMVEQLQMALSDAALFWAIVRGVAPALALRVIVVTLADYARADLMVRRGRGGYSALRAYRRAVKLLVRRPLALGHAALTTVLHVLVVLLFVWLSSGHALLGTGGAIALFLVRQGVVLLRTVITVGTIAGQVELARTLPPP